MATRRYKFSWDFIGNIELGRPNLGNVARIEVYRLFQYTLRDVLEETYGTEQADILLYKAGLLAGKEFYNKFIVECDSLTDFVNKTRDALLETGVGILRVEQADPETKQIVLTIAEDLDCSGLPDVQHSVCTYDEGFIAGLFKAYTGETFTVKEIDCWCTGDRVCRFAVTPVPDEKPDSV